MLIFHIQEIGLLAKTQRSLVLSGKEEHVWELELDNFAVFGSRYGAPIRVKYSNNEASRLRESASKYLLPVAFFAILVIVWEYSVNALDVPAFLLPSPTEIAGSFVKYGDVLVANTFVTLEEILIGFILGAGTGLLLGIAIAYSKVMSRVLYPLAIFVKTIPIVAIAPLLTLWFGFGIWSKVVCVSLVSFFPLVVSTALGLKSADPALIDLFHSLSASEIQIFFKARLPGSIPYIFSALKIAVTVSVIGAVVAEFVGSTKGLGYLALLAISYIETAEMFAILIMLAVLGLVLFALVSFAEKMFAPWAENLEAQTV